MRGLLLAARCALRHRAMRLFDDCIKHESDALLIAAMCAVDSSWLGGPINVAWRRYLQRILKKRRPEATAASCRIVIRRAAVRAGLAWKCFRLLDCSAANVWRW